MSRFSPEKKEQIKDTVFLVCLGLFVLAVLVLLLTGGFCVTHGAIHPRNADTLFVYQPEYETYTRIGGDVRYVIAVQDGQIRFYQEYSVSSLPLLRGWWEAELSYAYDLTAGTLVEEGGATLFPPPWNTPEEVLETAQVYGSEAWDGPNLWIPFSEKAPSFGEHPRRQFYLTGLTEREEILTDERTLFSHRMEDGRILYFLDYGPADMPTGI